MSEPEPVYLTPVYVDVTIHQPGYAELHSAYRATVSAALQLQRALHLPPEQCAVLEPAARRLQRGGGNGDLD